MLVDPYGSPISSNMFDAAQPWAGKRPYWPSVVRDIDRDINIYSWRRLVSDSRKLFSNFGPLQNAILEKSVYAVGDSWLPVFTGKDQAWGDAATEWLINEWMPICNVRGSMFNFQTDLFIESVSTERDGDFGILLTSFDGDYPALQSIPAHRIGNPDDIKDGKVPMSAGAPFSGCRIENGVILSPVGRPIGYHILGDAKEDNRYVTAQNLIHVYDPLWFDQSRGLPSTTPGILDLRDMMTTQGFEKQACQLASSIGLLEYNEDGGPDVSDPSVGLNTPQQNGQAGAPPLYTEILDGGSVRYFRQNSGAKLEQFRFDRPAQAWHEFQDRLLRASVSGIWPYELAWDSSKLGGANVRLIAAKAKRLIQDRQNLLRRPAKIKVGYAICKAIKLGILPKSDEWYRWSFTLPPQITVDAGRDSQQTREDLKLGIINMGDLQAQINGRTEEEHWRQRAYGVAMRKRIQQEVSEETGIPIDDRDMMMLSPNEQPDGEEGAGDAKLDPEQDDTTSDENPKPAKAKPDETSENQ